jgi:hypothetical protein
MAKAEIITSTNWFSIDLQPLIDLGIHFDRKFAKIKYDDIRSLNKDNNTTEIEIVFTNGEIQRMDFNNVKVDGVEPVDQDDFYNKMEVKIFV